MEYLPDFTVSYFFDHYLLASAAPAPNRTEDHSWVIGANLPIFFWLKQNEDVARARTNLEASRYDLASVKNQTAATVTSLYRSAQYGYQTAILYRAVAHPAGQRGFRGRADRVPVRQDLFRGAGRRRCAAVTMPG